MQLAPALISARAKITVKSVQFTICRTFMLIMCGLNRGHSDGVSAGAAPSHNVFVAESFIDEMARDGGVPLLRFLEPASGVARITVLSRR